MQKNTLLNFLLYSGSLYFFAVAIVHFLGIKIPMLFIYYDVDSTIYQDRIISVLSFVFAVFLYAGYKTYTIIKYILFAGIIGVLGLAANNYLTRSTFKNNAIYWLEIALLGIYVVSLLLLFLKGKK